MNVKIIQGYKFSKKYRYGFSSGMSNTIKPNAAALRCILSWGSDVFPFLHDFSPWSISGILPFPAQYLKWGLALKIRQQNT